MSAWIDQIFEADQATTHGVVRRAVADVEKYASRAELLDEVRRRGFHLVETGGQLVILCHQGALQVHC
ncbi:MAG TPA: hypothetical protein VGL81_30645 [Polyangiaceae bacterium]|jgi:hypothetical protein